MYFTKNLQAVRRKFNMSRKVFGDLMDLSYQQIQRLEIGSTEANGKHILKLSEVTGLSSDQLLKEIIPVKDLPSFPYPPIETVKEPPEDLPYRKKSSENELEQLKSILENLMQQMEELKKQLALQAKEIKELKDKNRNAF